MACGCQGGASAQPKYRWISADGKQTVTNLTRVQAQTRINRKGGTIQAQ